MERVEQSIRWVVFPDDGGFSCNLSKGLRLGGRMALKVHTGSLTSVLGFAVRLCRHREMVCSNLIRDVRVANMNNEV